MRLKICFIALCVAATVGTAMAAAPAASGQRTLTHEDLWTMPRVGAAKLSADGRWAVVPVVEPAYDEKQQKSDLWLIDTSGVREPRRLTGTSGREGDAIWSPDGSSIAFSARRDGDEKAQIYLLPLAGGDAARLTNTVNGARTPVFSPDGSRLLYVSDVYPGATDDASQRRVAAERKARPWNARIYEGFPIRNWDRWLDDLKPHVFVLTLPAPGTLVGAAVDLLAGTKFAAEPGFSGRFTDSGQSLDAIWTPDGSAVVFVASTDRNRAAYSFTSSQVFRVAASGGEPVALTSGLDQWSEPAFSPDGRTLYALVERRTEKVYNRSQLASLAWSAAAAPRWLTSAVDLSISRFAISADSREIFLQAEQEGRERVFRLPARGGKATALDAESRGAYTNLVVADASPRPVMLANWESAQNPPEIVRIDPATGKHRVLTRFASARAAALDLPAVRDLWFTSSRGKRIHSFIVVPPGFDPNKRYPLFNVIHGGPHTMFRDQWVLRWNYHLLAAPGYVLVLTNYSGSTGLGEAFAQSIQGDPLRGPGDELNEASDAAIREMPFIDGSRQCAGGASYGGHLSNWLQASTTRYRCLVSHAGLVNLEAQWGTSDVVYSREVSNGGPVWEQGPVWREQNPIRYTGRFKTPTLVTIGEQDFRVPLNNSLEYWTALQRMQVPSRLVVFPTENHWVLNGENSRLFYSEVHGWLARWLAPAPAAAASGATAVAPSR